MDTTYNILYCEGNMDETVGGSFFSLLYLTKNLDRTQFKPHVIFHKHNSLIPQYQSNDIKTSVIEKKKNLCFNKPVNDSSLLYKASYPFLKLIQKALNLFKFFPVTVFNYVFFIRKHNIHLIHLNNTVNGNHDWMLAALILNIPCLTHERAIYNNYSRLSYFLAPKLKSIICISDSVKNNLLKHSFSSSNLITIYNGIEPNDINATKLPQYIKKNHNIPSCSQVIGVVGNIREWKGQETAINALSSIHKTYPNVILVLVGEAGDADASYLNKLKGQIKKQKLEKYVVFTGYTTDVSSYINIMDIVLHTSVEPEPFGRVLIEAMSMKKPLIASNAGAIPEIIENELTGLTFKPGDAKELSLAVCRMLSNMIWANHLAGNGYKRLLKNFHIQENIKQTQRLYNDILNTDKL